MVYALALRVKGVRAVSFRRSRKLVFDLAGAFEGEKEDRGLNRDVIETAIGQKRTKGVRKR